MDEHPKQMVWGQVQGVLAHNGPNCTKPDKKWIKLDWLKWTKIKERLPKMDQIGTKWNQSNQNGPK